MADPIKVDSHVHLYPSVEAGLADKEGYQIWEYGERAEVSFSDYAGTLDDAMEAMKAADIVKAVIVNLFMGRLMRDAAIESLPAGLGAAERDTAIAGIDAGLLDPLNGLSARPVAVIGSITSPETAYSAKLPNHHLRPPPDCSSHARAGVFTQPRPEADFC